MELGDVRVVPPEAAMDVLLGARITLARAGMLREPCEIGETCVRMRIDVLRALEEPAAPGWDNTKNAVIARGIWVRVLGRARLYGGVEGGDRLRDTGEMGAGVLLSHAGDDAPAFAVRRSQAFSAAARKLGERLSAALLGTAGPGADEMSMKGFSRAELRASVTAP